jgi:hypothetical protein
VILAVALLTLALAGCGGSDSKKDSEVKVANRQEMIKEGNALCAKVLGAQAPVTPIDLSNAQLAALATKSDKAAAQLRRIKAPRDVATRLAPTLTSLSRVARGARRIIPINRDTTPATARAAQETLVRNLAQLRISTKISRLPSCEIPFRRI